MITRAIVVRTTAVIHWTRIVGGVGRTAIIIICVSIPVLGGGDCQSGADDASKGRGCGGSAATMPPVSPRKRGRRRGGTQRQRRRSNQHGLAASKLSFLSRHLKNLR